MCLFRLVCLPNVLLMLTIISGCTENGPTTSSPTVTTNASTPSTAQVETVEAAQQTYVETIDLPGASIHGFETTVLESKIGGYVKKIHELRNPRTGELEEVDIGSYAKRGDVLTDLDVPEMMDELTRSNAVVLQAESEVAQANAAIRQSEAEVSSAKAALEEAKMEYEEKDAMRRFRQSELQNQQKLFQQRATTRELVDKAQSQLDAALAVIATVEARIQTATAKADAAVAHREKTEADLKKFQAYVKVVEAARDRVQTLLGYAQIRAPFDGLISKRMVHHGAFVRPATSNSAAMPLFEITRSDKVRIDANVPMSRVQRIRVGQPVIIHTIGGLPGVTVAGEITRSAAVLDHDSRMMNIQVHLTNPVSDARFTRQQDKWIKTTSDTSEKAADVVLQPGMYATVTMLETWEDLAIVPTTAVGVDESGNHFVYTLATANGKTLCQSTFVDIVFNDAKDVGISRGIKPGQQIIARNIDQLKDGLAVAVKDDDG